MKTIRTIGVIGAGTMGSALAQKFAQEGFDVVLHDRGMEFVDRGIASIRKTLTAGIERKLFTPDGVEKILQRIHGTVAWEDLSRCDLVVEAIFEFLQAKTDLFRRLSAVLPADTIIATNTSSFSVTELAQSVLHPERFIGLHFFYHAAKNRLVEIIPGHKTSNETMRAAQRFAFLAGKDPIVCRDRYGFAVNRFFVPWLNEAARLLQEGVAPIATIDSVCMQVFGIGMGPFALMNATGVPIAYHSQRTLEALGTFYSVADVLKDQAEANKQWELGDPAAVAIDPETERRIRERMLGAVFLVCGQIFDEQVCSPVELNRGARIGLQWKRGPVEMMRALGRDEVDRLVRPIATRYQTAFPRGIKRAFDEMEYVMLRTAGRHSIITIARPEDLNALNENVVAQLDQKFSDALHDPNTDTIILTGTGKAFIAGADIGLFLEHMRKGTIEKIVTFTQFGQQVLDRIDHSKKQVIALLNGLTLGGGLEVALCADKIYALPTVKMAFPETGIGIYPGLGGTQRTQRRVGKGMTKYLIFTGEMLGAKDAAGMGLVDAVITPDMYFEMLEGSSPEKMSISMPVRDARWTAINAFFETNTLDAFLDGEQCAKEIPAEELERWRKRIKQKAPIALHTAERLVNEARGCASELEPLSGIFKTNDAMLGLGSVGKKVVFNGN